MSEVVPTENIAIIRSLPADEQAVAITSMLTEARSWLAHAVEASEPMTIANFKAQMATIAEAAKQLNLSKAIQLDAVEMVRRAERGVGVSVRQGQADGTIRNRGEHEFAGNQHVRSAVSHQVKNSTTEYATNYELNGNGGSTPGIYALADDVTDEAFDAAIEEAKAEGNLSRANVVRKVRGQSGHVTREQRADQIRDLAAEDKTSPAIAKALGITAETVRLIARDFGFAIRADEVQRGRRRINWNTVLANTAEAVEVAANAMTELNPQTLDPESARTELDSLTTSIKALSKAIKTIKESL